MPDLMSSRWPQLRELSIGCLDDSGLKHLHHCPWSTLERLQLSDCNMSPISTRCLRQAYLPYLQELSLINIAFDPDVYLCCAQLAQGEWPLLSKFQLHCLATGFTQDCIRVLATANWPRLQTLIFDCLDFFDEDITSLPEAYWPALRSLTLCGWFTTSVATIVLPLCMQKWPALESLTVCTSSPTVSAAILEQASNQWPSLQVHFDPRRCHR